MANEGDYSINDVYPGRYSSLAPETYSPNGVYTGHRMPSSLLGAPTKPDTANQIAQVSMLLNQGIVPIEVGALSPDVFDQIPKQHFKEIQRMANLAGADISVHAPLIEASGIDSQNQQPWNESTRLKAEKQIMNVIDRTAPLNKKGEMSITFHGSVGVPGTELTKTKQGIQKDKIIVINQETGKMVPLEREEKYYPGNDLSKPKVFLPEDLIKNMNDTEWDNSISQLLHHKEDADARINENLKIIPPQVLNQIMRKEINLNELPAPYRNAYNRLFAGEQFLSDAHQALNGMFNKAWKFAETQDKKDKLRKASEDFKKQLETRPDPIGMSNAIQNLAENLKEVAPQIYKPAEEFAIGKSAETFSNVALHAFEKYENEAPSINIENMFPEMAFSYGESWKNLIEQSRNKFVEKAVQKGILSEKQAKIQAEKLIGATLDVGHLNIQKKKGFMNEDLIKEVEQIAPYVKHVHLTDNFGASDSHLPPGMGNVPFKEILETLKEKGYEGKGIVEAAGWPQHFGSSPFSYVLEAFGSETYSGGPYWNQATSLTQNYSGGFGNMLPQVHYQTFGAGFTTLPPELGGNMPGAQGSRLGGTPME